MNFYRNKPAAVPTMSEGGTISPIVPQPSSGPLLAVPYVLPQQWEQTYEPAAALKRGTIFPSLDLPFLWLGGAR